MTGNTQELDEIIEHAYNAGFSAKDMVKQAILDWHNKQVIQELEELLGQQDHEGHLVEPTSNSVRGRINKLKEVK